MPSGGPRTPRVMNWSLSPRPRSPEQFISMMSVLVQFNGAKWWKKDKNGDPATQIAFLDALMEHPDFSLLPRAESVMQGRTYVTMNPPALGFAYISDEKNADDKRLVVTEAGFQAADGGNLQTLFTKQLLKWQYPSYVHGGPGGKGSAHFPLRDRWSLHPFLATMYVCRELEYLSKHEIAVYLLTMIRDADVDKVVDEITKYRAKLASLQGARARDELRNKILESKMREVYEDEIEAGRYKKRQADANMARSQMISEMISAKMRNNMDYTDTVMRYFRFSGLFKESDRWQNLKINPQQEWKVEEVLRGWARFSRLNKDYESCAKFYSYFGSPSEPKLPWETEDGLIRAIVENLRNTMAFLGIDCSELNSKSVGLSIINNCIAKANAGSVEKGVRLNSKLEDLGSNRINELSRASEQTQEVLREVGRVTAADSFRGDAEFRTTLEMFESVEKNKKWDDPYMEVPLLFEWAVYRSIYGIGGIVLEECSPKLNYDGTEPIFTASGRQCDVVGEFKMSYLAVESTVTSGARQYDAEAEPVTRHLARFIEKHKDKPTLCFFVARNLDENTKEFFSIYNVYHRYPSIGAFLSIVPLEIDGYVRVLKSLREKKSLDGQCFKDILAGLDTMREDRKCRRCSRPDMTSEKWYQGVETIMNGILD